MKKLLILGVVMLMLSPCFAQPEDGDLIIGGAFRIQTDGQRFRYENDDVERDYRNITFNFGPRVHYMLTEHISLGGTIFVNIDNQTTFDYPNGFDEDPEKTTNKAIGFGFGPIARYWYQIGEKKKFGLFVEGGFTYSTTKQEFENPTGPEDIDGRINGKTVYVVPGMYYAPTKRFFFEVTFGGFGVYYNHQVFRPEDSETKVKRGYLDVGGNLEELFFGDTAIGFNIIL